MADTEIVLLPEEDGRVGKVAVTGAQGTVLLERPFEGTSVTAGAAPLTPKVQPTASIAERFAALLAFQQQSGFGDPGDLQKLFRITPDRRTDDRGGQGLETSNLAEAGILQGEESTDTEGDKGIALDIDEDVEELAEEAEEVEDAEEVLADSLGQPPDNRRLLDADDDPLDRFLSLLDDGRSFSRRLRSRSDRDDDQYDEFDGGGPGDDDDPFPRDDDDELFNGGDGGESLSGGIGKDTIAAGLGDDTLDGGVGQDLLQGGDGDDVLIGGPGADQLEGGPGIDVADYGASDSAVSVDLATGATSGGDAASDTLLGVEDVIGSDFEDSLTGSDGGNRLDGRDGDDTLDGGEGDDTLVGAGGVDTLVGGGGADSLLGGVGADELSGNGGNDTISGGVGADQLTGGSGDDILEGGAAADELQGGAGIDTASFAEAGEAVAFAFAGTDGSGIAGDFSNTAAGGLAGDADGDSFASIEAFVGSDFGDTVGGGSIDMTFTLGAGDDRFDTPAGIDVVDNLFGGDGADLAFTGDGNDSVEGGAGNDSLRGEAGSDTLIGNADNDDLSGAAGSDSLIGGAGVDTMSGGAGSDRFVFQALTDGTEVAVNDTIANVGAAVDVISDFATGVDLLEFASAEFGNPGLALTVGAYDGTNAIGVAAGATLVFDGTHLIFDPDVDQAGYVAIADLSGAVPVLADISLV